MIFDEDLCLLPRILQDLGENIPIGLFINSFFPSHEVFQLFPYKEEILESFLSLSTIYFNDFNAAQPFYTIILLNRNINYYCKMGVFYFSYKNKEIAVKFKSLNLDVNYYEKYKLNEDYLKLIANLDNQYKDHNLIVSIDDLSDMKALELKINFVANYMKKNEDYYHLKFIQIIESKQKIENLDKLFSKLNEKLENKQRLIILYDLSEYQKLAYLAISKIFLNGSIRNNYCYNSIKFLLLNIKKGIVVLSEFINYNRSCVSILRYNPLHFNEFQNRIDMVFKFDQFFLKELLRNDIEQLKKESLSKIISSFLVSIDEISILSNQTNKTTSNLNMINLIKDFNNAKNRLIIFDFEDVLINSGSLLEISSSKNSKMVLANVDSEILRSLGILIQDRQNSLFLLSEKNADFLNQSFGHLAHIGLAAEYGYIYKEKGKMKWTNLFIDDWSWKEVVKKTMVHYTKNTEGSSIEFKESCLKWNFKKTPVELADLQAPSLTKHLQSSLEYHKEIEVVNKEKNIETRPKGITKVNGLG